MEPSISISSSQTNNKAPPSKTVFAICFEYLLLIELTYIGVCGKL